MNYIYCDVFSLHLADTLNQLITGDAGGFQITEEFLLYFSFVMEIPMAMIVLSRILVFRVNKYANVLAAFISGSIQAWTVSMGGTLHYMFFSVIEISTAIAIIYLAITWKDEKLL